MYDALGVIDGPKMSKLGVKVKHVRVDTSFSVLDYYSRRVILKNKYNINISYYISIEFILHVCVCGYLKLYYYLLSIKCVKCIVKVQRN